MGVLNDITGGALGPLARVAEQLGGRVKRGLEVLSQAKGDPSKIIVLNSIRITAQVRLVDDQTAQRFWPSSRLS